MSKHKSNGRKLDECNIKNLKTVLHVRKYKQNKNEMAKQRLQHTWKKTI